MKKIGITGVMGAGKSSVIEIVKELSYTVLDCDQINDKLLQKQQKGYSALVERFQDAILNEQKEIDRVRMSELMFTNPKAKKEIEAILHPCIQQEIEKAYALHMQEEIVFVEVPLLYEIHWESSFDEVWVVASDEALLLERLTTHRHVSLQEAKRRLAHQMPQAEKVKKADVVLWNNSNKENLKRKICDILVHSE